LKRRGRLDRLRVPRLRLRGTRIATRFNHWFQYDPVGKFVTAVARLIWQYRAYSAAIVVATVVQEFAALWPVNLLGEFIDRMSEDNVGNTVWLLLLASLLYPALLRGNVILRRMMFYETDFRKMTELVVIESDRGEHTPETSGAAYTRLANAVAGITNATYHTLGSFTPIIIKIIIVSGRLLSYSRLLGLVYLASLTVPAGLTVLANSKMRRLRDSQYVLSSDASGLGMRVVSDSHDLTARAEYASQMHVRKGLLQRLVATSQAFILSREAVLVGSQFVVVFMALAMRDDLGITAGDFAKIIGYTTQVAAAFVVAASTLDSVVSFTRAFHVYVTRGRLN